MLFSLSLVKGDILGKCESQDEVRAVPVPLGT